MSVLTRIKNNQITDSTIFANTKIVPGSIVGSLFNSNLTMTSDVTITGNLTVQGSSTYLTVASTNTYVNDPLIVMNNAFAGTNTNDIGLLFNRGSNINQAFIWDESEDEFRLVATTETGTTYGNVTTDSYANLRVGNISIEGAAALGSLSITGGIDAANLTLSGDLAVNGGDITTTETTFNLVNANATTVNFAGEATLLTVGSSLGVANIQSATTNLLGNATVNGTLSVVGHVTLEGVTSTGATGTGNLVFSDSPTLTTPNIGTPSFANLTNATDLPISTGVSGLATGVADFLVTPTSSNLLAVVTDETGTGNLVFSDSPTLTTPNIGTPSFANLTNATDLPISTGVSGLATGVADFLVTPTSSNLISAITDETGTGNLVFSTSPTLETSVVTTSTSFDLLNATATTVNFAGDATTLTIAATSGNTAIRNNLDVGLTLTAQDINNTVIGNVIPASATFTTATVQGNTSLGLTTAAAINNTPIGNAVASTGSFTTLVASGVTQITDTTTATSIGTGAFRVDGGASVAGNLWVGGNINIVGNTFTISGNSGQFFGDINGFGALYAGVTGFTTLPQTVFQVAASVDDYAQINFENVDTGTQASTDYVATAGNGDDFNHYINMGITSPNWDGTQDNSLTTALSGNDGYLYAQGDVGGGGNLVIGASTAGRTVSIIVGGNTASSITAIYRAPGTASTNTTTGALTVIGGVGILGNVYANNLSTGGEISAGDLTLTGNLGVNGGDITTTATTFNLLDANVTTINAFGAATTIDLGAATGTLTINNPTVVGSSATQDLYNTTATTLNFAGAATTLNIGADTGTATINNDTINLEGNVNVNQTTPSTNSTTGALVVDGGVGIAGNLNIGEDVVITGNLTVQGAVTTLNTSTLDVEDLNITVAKGAVDSAAADGAGLTVDGANATLTYNHATTSWDLNKVTRITDATDTTDETTGALRVAGGVAIAKDLFVGGGDIITDETTFNLLNTTATTLNIGGAATTLNLGAITGNLVINNPTVVGSQATQDLYNTTATTLNFAGAATTLTIGATTGTATIRNALVDIDGNATVGGTLGVTGDTTLTGDLAVNGGDLTTTATTFNLIDATATTLNAFGSATLINLGATTGTLTINNPTVVGTQTTQNLYNTTATTVNAFGAASTLVLGDTSGIANIRNATTNIIGNATVGGTLEAIGAVTFTDDLAVNGGDITTTATTATVFNTNATTVDAFKAATDLEFGATTGTLTINNPTVVGTQTTQDLFNTTATTVNFAGAATTLSIGASSGNTLINNTLDIANTVIISSTGIELANTKITNLQGPTAGADAANKTYVDTALDTFVGTANITLVGTLPNLTVGNLNATSIVSTGTATLGNLTADRINDTVIGDITPAVATFTNVTDQSLTATRVTFAGTGGDLTDSANFTFASNILTVKNFSINGDTAEISVVGGSGNVILNPDAGGVIDATGSLISNVANPVSAQDVVTLSYLNSELTSNIGALAKGDSDVTVTDLGTGAITANVDAVSVLTITSATADFFTDLLSLNNTTGNVTLTGNLSVTETTELTGKVSILASDASTDSITGALVVTGGVGIGGKLNLANGAVINDAQSSDSFQVKGQVATTLIYADSVTDTVTIGGSNTTPISGATLRVNGTGAMVLPVGTTSQRPSVTGNVDVRGMIRLNSSLNILEYYDGTAWQSSQGSFTVITSEIFTGNGIATSFELSNDATTSATIVSINGVVQIPVISYSISGSTLEFTEAPDVGDTIDVRKLATTSVVSSIGEGFTEVAVDGTFANISTGTSSTEVRLRIDSEGVATFTNDVVIEGNLTVNGGTNGVLTLGDSDTDNVVFGADIDSSIIPNSTITYDLGSASRRWRNIFVSKIVHEQIATNVATTATPVIVDSFASTDYSSAKYIVQIKQGSTNVQVMEALLVHDGVDAYVTTYGVIDTNGTMGSLTANISGSDVNLYYTSSSLNNSNVKVQTTYIV